MGPRPFLRLVVGVVGRGAEQVDNVVDAELQGVLLASRAGGGALDGLFGHEAFLFLELEDALLDGLFHCELVDDDVDGLREAVNTIDGLFLDKLRLC